MWLEFVDSFCVGYGIPGPGHYSSKSSQLKSHGKYFISKLHDSGCAYFGKNKRAITEATKRTNGNFRPPIDLMGLSLPYDTLL